MSGISILVAIGIWPGSVISVQPLLYREVGSYLSVIINIESWSLQYFRTGVRAKNIQTFNAMKLLLGFIILGFILSFSEIDHDLFMLINYHQLSVMTKPETDPLEVELGGKLFFDKILSGNKDISCATCHHPTLNSSDDLSLSIGSGGIGLGSSRQLGYDRTLIPRNSPDIFNRGATEWTTMFWDSRVSIGKDDSIFHTPVEDKLPQGLDNLLSVQALFPMFSRDEMRGEIGNIDVYGNENELALISNGAPQSVWDAIVKRILSISEYRELFKKTYPDTPLDEIKIHHVTNAIAAFEIEAFTFLDSPWDQYLSGSTSALSVQQKKGAILFYGKAGCVSCHSGNLMTDQEHHNIGVPQFGPGKGNAEPLDVGRFAESGESTHSFAFRTPPLRNVVLTSPYLHNGAYRNLYDVIRHHLDPVKSLKNYDKTKLSVKLQKSFQDSKTVQSMIVESIDERLKTQELKLTDEEIDALFSFMTALTDQSLKQSRMILPTRVPSGLPVD